MIARIDYLLVMVMQEQTSTHKPHPQQLSFIISSLPFSIFLALKQQTSTHAPQSVHESLSVFSIDGPLSQTSPGSVKYAQQQSQQKQTPSVSSMTDFVSGSHFLNGLVTRCFSSANLKSFSSSSSFSSLAFSSVDPYGPAQQRHTSTGDLLHPLSLPFLHPQSETQ